MKILLIHPPDSKVSIAPGRFEPLALEVLAACVPLHEVRILDLRIDKFRELDNQLTTFKPAVAGITVNNAIHCNPAKKVIGDIVTNHPSVKVIVGGFHAAMMPEDFRIPGISAIFSGWAEKSFPEYIDSLENNNSLESVRGIEVLENGRTLFRNPAAWDLEPSDIPYPRRDLVYKYYKKYRSDTGFKTALVNTTRGCPYRCSFCGVWQVAGGHFLIRPPEHVFNEISEIPSNIHRVFFADDNTFINPANAAGLYKLIRESGIRKKYSGYCRSDTIIRYPELMHDWKEIGLDNLCVGFEGTDNTSLQQFNKKNEEVNNARAAQILNDIGIPFRPHFLIEPTFTGEDFRRIFEYVQHHKLKSPIYPILTPIPGTAYYNEVKDQIILGYDYFDYAHSTMKTTLPPKEFYALWVRLYTHSYPLLKNFKNFFLNKLSGLSGNISGKRKYAYLNLVNLLMLQLFGILLKKKIMRHIIYLEQVG
jgi:hopanoid C-3 methylase